MCCFYPGNVICLNAPCSPGARPAAVIVFLRLGCQSEPGYLWESRPAGSSRPHPGIWTRLLRFIGGQSLWDLWRRCVVRVNTVSGQVNRDGSVASLQQRKGKSGVERALDLAAAVWSWFYKKCSHRKYLRIVMCKQDWCWWEQSLVRTDIKQRGVELTLFEERFHADTIIKEKPVRERKERKNDWAI